MDSHKHILCFASRALSLVQIGYKNKVNISEVHDAQNLLSLQLNRTTASAVIFFLACLLILFYFVAKNRYL